MNKDLFHKAIIRMQAQAPLVLNITNYVAMSLNANALLALGASPIMAHAQEELADLLAHTHALVLNIGTLDPVWVEAMHTALLHAKKLEIPVVLDPVGVHASAYRLSVAKLLLNVGGITVIRGNAAEIMALGEETGKGQGVDSADDTSNAIGAAERLLEHYPLKAVAVSGAVDRVLSVKGKWALARGDAMMQKVTAMGCTASALCGAFLGVEKSTEEALGAALSVMSIAGERAKLKAGGPGSFAMHFLDALSHWQKADFETLEWYV